MSDWPNSSLPPLPTLTPFSEESLGNALKGIAPSSGTWPVSNKAYFYPFFMDKPATAYRMFVSNGATNGNNLDVGIYDSALQRIVSLGSTAQGTVSVIQIADIADTLLNPGQYFMALTFNGTTSTVIRSVPADEIVQPVANVLELTGAFALPADASAAVKCTDATIILPVFGINFTTTM